MPRKPASLRNALIVAGSVALHVVFLGWLASRALGIDMTAYWPPIEDPMFPNAINVQLSPRPDRLPGQGSPLHRAETLPRWTPPVDAPDTYHDPKAAPFRDPTARAPNPGAAVQPAPATSQPSAPQPAPSLPPSNQMAPADPWRVRPEARAPNAALARSMRLSPSGCRAMAGWLSPEDQAVCDTRMASATARAPTIVGTGNPERDAQFAAEGAAEIARYENRRAALKPNSRAAPCPGADMMGRCPAIITIPLVSSKF